jgi:predicted AAA+ superfamily ATPase
MAQIASQVGTPMMLIGPQNSGKKTIVELYAKNMRNKSQFCSIRYRNRETLPSQIEKPFRRLNGLEGIVMKSVTVSKKLIVSI